MLPHLDAWVLRKVAQRRAGSAARFSLNVSGQTVEHEDFVRLFHELATPRGSLLFEIEESEIALRPHAVQRFSQGIRDGGGGIVVDGFGRGTLSLASFASLRPDFVKIDGALTRNMPSDESSLRRVQAIARLARSLGFGLIAECVETQDVLLLLESLGVQHAQGYGVCPPLPMEVLLAREPLLAAA
jgi:EAL domain-containing protein (putative c-di-GMP-specific phosphodiesterase class I)